MDEEMAARLRSWTTSPATADDVPVPATEAAGIPTQLADLIQAAAPWLKGQVAYKAVANDLGYEYVDPRVALGARPFPLPCPSPARGEREHTYGEFY